MNLSHPPTTTHHPLTVRVLLNARGQWEVLPPHTLRPLRCGSIEEAEAVAYQCASRTRPCEVIVHDAYHRVVHRELVNDH
jgi:hypothetical protein